MHTSEKQIFKVLMFPFLAHGHISPLVELAKRLSDRNFHIYLCSSPVNLSSIKNRISEQHSLKIEFVELHLPSLPDLPPHHHTSNGLPLHLNHLLTKLLKMAKPSFTEILEKLKPDLLIHDILQLWAGVLASRLNIPAVTFFTSGAAICSYFCHLSRYPGTEFPFPAIRLTEFEVSLALSNIKSAQDDRKDPDDQAVGRNDMIVLMNTCREMEGKYIDYVAQLMGWNIIPIGALIQEPNLGDDDADLMEWLGKKDEFSGVFVSFGSEYFLEKEDIEEIAYGLETSNVNFIWVIRSPKGVEMRLEEILPQGFLERIGERGKVLDKWAPQAKILRHSSIGGFVSHCGWNSIMESIDFGVPIIAMPMHLDQPLNAKLVVELGVGVEVKRDIEAKYRREEISRVIQDVVFGETGKGLRTKIEIQRENIRLRSKEEVDEVVCKLTEICGKSRADA